MKSSLMAQLVVISFLLVAGCCCSARSLENNLNVAPANRSAFDPNLNSVAEDYLEKDAVQRDEEDRAWSSSSVSSVKRSENVMKKIWLKLSPNIQKLKKADELPESNEAEGVLNLMPKGRHNLQVNSAQITEQRLSTSSNSPGVGHMQMIPHKRQTRNVDMIKPNHSNGDDHLQQNKRNKRKLGSTPSPGVGN